MSTDKQNRKGLSWFDNADDEGDDAHHTIGSRSAEPHLCGGRQCNSLSTQSQLLSPYPQQTTLSTSPNNLDVAEFLLPLPPDSELVLRNRPMPAMPARLSEATQLVTLHKRNLMLIDCAAIFVARHRLPILGARSELLGRSASDQRWAHWIDSFRALLDAGRIKPDMVRIPKDNTISLILASSLLGTSINHNNPGSICDDFFVLEAISSALQIALLLKDGYTAGELDSLYIEVIQRISGRRRTSS